MDNLHSIANLLSLSRQRSLEYLLTLAEVLVPNLQPTLYTDGMRSLLRYTSAGTSKTDRVAVPISSNLLSTTTRHILDLCNAKIPQSYHDEISELFRQERAIIDRRKTLIKELSHELAPIITDIVESHQDSYPELYL